MNPSNVTIKNPCHLKLNDLTKIKNSKDLHCNECSWIIKDFRNMTNKEIINYLNENKEKKVCCVMSSDENKSRRNKIQKTIKDLEVNTESRVKNNYLKKFLLFFVGILMLTTGCENEDENIIIGEPSLPEDESGIIVEAKTKLNDSTFVKIPKKKHSLDNK